MSTRGTQDSEVKRLSSTISGGTHAAVENTKYKLTADELKMLSASCIEAKSKAYCATFLTMSGTYISGANVENAAYPVTVCAERCALGTAVASEGLRRGDFKALAVATDIVPGASPCGMCRQGLREFCEDSMPIYMHDKDGKYVVKTLGELLPMSFGPEDLPPVLRTQQ